MARVLYAVTGAIGLAMVAGPSAQAAPLPEATEVTGAWVCESQGHRVADFRVVDGTAATFAIPRFDPALGEFRRIEVTSDVDLISTMSLTLAMSQAQALIEMSAVHEVWMNIPPHAVTPNSPPLGDERANNLVLEFGIPWAQGVYQAGVTELGTRTGSDSGSFTSTDTDTWSGPGEQQLTLQTFSSVSIVGAGGNGTYTQVTTAAAEVCHRYTYLPLAEEEQSVPSPSPAPPQPTQPPAPTPSDPELADLPNTGAPVSHSIAALSAVLVAGGAALLMSRRRAAERR